VVGGMTWCIMASNEEVDVDLLFQENSTIGQKMLVKPPKRRRRRRRRKGGKKKKKNFGGSLHFRLTHAWHAAR
jgi:hypothetical protein